MVALWIPIAWLYTFYGALNSRLSLKPSLREVCWACHGSTRLGRLCVLGSRDVTTVV